MLESNSPGITHRRLIRTMSRERPVRPLPFLVIRVSHRTDRSPYAMKNSSGEPVGFPLWPIARPPFKLVRRQVTQRRVQTCNVVIAVDECVEVGAQILDVPVLETANLLLLQRFHEAFTFRIIVGIARPAHTRNHAVLKQHVDVSSRRILGGFNRSSQQV